MHKAHYLHKYAVSNRQNHFTKYSNIRSILLHGRQEQPITFISILIPTYKRPHLLKASIDSALNQTYDGDYEVIVVDNEKNYGEEESATLKLIRQYSSNKLCYYSNTDNIGMVGNWNRCVELSKGEYVTILHDDDWLDQNFLEEAIKRIDGEKALIFKVKLHDERIGLIKERNSSKDFLKAIIHKITPNKHKLSLFDFFLQPIASGTLGVLYKRNILMDLGGFDETKYPIQDYLLHIDYLLHSGCTFWKIELANYRILMNESKNVIETSIVLVDEKRNELIEYINLPRCFLNYLKYYLLLIDKETISKFWNCGSSPVTKKHKTNNFMRMVTFKPVKILLKTRSILFYN
jgi:glycosyltransferase involved in cell wall biosynthesis